MSNKDYSPFAAILSGEEDGTIIARRFLELVDYALTQARSLTADYPILENGFTVKFHVGAFESVPHPKLHILSSE